MLLDGTQAMAADMSLGGFKITNLADGVSASDAVNLSQLQAAQAGIISKPSVRVASTANIDLATGGELTIDGVALSAGDRVLVKDQTDATENGIYVVASGAWNRSIESDGSPLILLAA